MLQIVGSRSGLAYFFSVLQTSVLSTQSSDLSFRTWTCHRKLDPRKPMRDNNTLGQLQTYSQLSKMIKKDTK